jgi:glycosyltransferase involved in cell wall biosynthesis
MGVVLKEYRWFHKRNEKLDNVEIKRCFVIGRGNSKIKLALNYLSYVLSATIKILFLPNDYDVVFVYQLSPVTMAIPAIIYKLKSKKKLFLYCLDLWPESIKTTNITEDSTAFKIIHLISKWIYKKCDYIAVTSKSFIEYLIKVNGVSQSKISFLPQHAEELYLSVKESPYQKETISFLFAGNIGKIQNIEIILEAVSRIKTEKKFKVNFVGDGSFLNDAQKMAVTLRIEDKIAFLGRHQLDEMVDFYSEADAFLITLKGGLSVSDTIPSKLQGYMAAGKPVIGSISGPAKELIIESNCGFCVEADDADGLKKLMEKFINNPNEYKHLGANGRRYFLNNFKLEVFQKRLLQTINQLL